MSDRNLGLVRVGAAVPKLKIANTKYNTQEILRMIREAEENKTGFIVFPELCITGYTCGDLFYQEHLYEGQLDGLEEICSATKDLQVIVILGCYFRVKTNLYNCAVLIQQGKIRGIAPKLFLPGTREFSEGRWFASGLDLIKFRDTLNVFGEEIPFGSLIFHDDTCNLTAAMEICQDLWLPLAPGAQLALNGAQIIFNASASNEIVGKANYRRNLVSVESSKSNCGYVYTSAGVHESTTDLVFSGHSMIAEDGEILTEAPRFQRDSLVIYSELDFQRIRFERCQNPNFSQCADAFTDKSRIVRVPLKPVRLVSDQETLRRNYPKNPFTAGSDEEIRSRCSEIFNLQASGLAKRLEHSHAAKSIIGISGGLDSTLALLATAYTYRMLGRPMQDIVTVTMPGFGTTGKTYNNAVTLMQLLGTEIREISIKESVLQHFKDIEQDPNKHDITYENAQARERTQILMDVANQNGGLVIGTGDLSEMALGWCTYNGDHMSMYAVNASIPKTLVRRVVEWFTEDYLGSPDEDKGLSSDNALLQKTLRDILATPISPELLPPDETGNIAQKTEETVGPYELHDFFIYYTLHHGMSPQKLLFTAKNAFAGEYDEAFIKKWAKTFYRRFFSQQFKRSCVPDGPKVGSVCLSPRGDWKMASDADPSIWLDALD